MPFIARSHGSPGPTTISASPGHHRALHGVERGLEQRLLAAEMVVQGAPLVTLARLATSSSDVAA